MHNARINPRNNLHLYSSTNWFLPKHPTGNRYCRRALLGTQAPLPNLQPEETFSCFWWLLEMLHFWHFFAMKKLAMYVVLWKALMFNIWWREGSQVLNTFPNTKTVLQRRFCQRFFSIFMSSKILLLLLPGILGRPVVVHTFSKGFSALNVSPSNLSKWKRNKVRVALEAPPSAQNR